MNAKMKIQSKLKKVGNIIQVKVKDKSQIATTEVRKAKLKNRKVNCFSIDPGQSELLKRRRIVETNGREGKLFESPTTRFHVAGIDGSEAYNVGSRVIGVRIFYQPKITEIIEIGKRKEKMQKVEAK